MALLDKQGRLFGKVSIIDCGLLIIIIALLFGFGYRTLSSRAVQIVNANTKFYVTFTVEKLRDFSVNAVGEGDMFFQQYGQQALGKVVAVKTETPHEIMRKPDGTAIYAEMEGKFNLFVTLECTGNINDNGYFINGNVQVSVGSDVRLQSNKVLCSARVSAIDLDI